MFGAKKKRENDVTVYGRPSIIGMYKIPHVKGIFTFECPVCGVKISVEKSAYISVTDEDGSSRMIADFSDTEMRPEVEIRIKSNGDVVMTKANIKSHACNIPIPETHKEGAKC